MPCSDAEILAPSSGLLIQRSNNKFRVNVIVDRCKECGICIALCPTRVLVKSNTLFNRYGFRPPEPLYIEKCIGCRLCEYSCPDFALFVEKVSSG